MSKKPDVYVEIGSMNVKKSGVDKGLKDVKLNKMSAVMTKAATAYFKKKSGFITQKPKEEGGPAFCVSGNVISLAKKTKGKQELLMATVSFALTTLPDNKMIPGKLEGIGGTSLGKDLQGDAEFAIATATEKACETAVEQIGHATK